MTIKNKIEQSNKGEWYENNFSTRKAFHFFNRNKTLKRAIKYGVKPIFHFKRLLTFLYGGVKTLDTYDKRDE